MPLHRAALNLTRVLGITLAIPLGFFSAGAALAAQGGRWSPALDGFSHFAPFWLAGGLCVIAAGFVMARGALRKFMLTLGCVGVFAAAALIAPEYLRDPGPRTSKPVAPVLKLIQFNLAGEFNVDPERTAAWIAAQDADVVALEESSLLVRDAVLRRRPYHVSCHGCSVTILTRAKPLAGGAEPGSRPAPAMTRVTLAGANGDYTVIAAHLSWPTPDGLQQAQADALDALASRFPRDRLILAGDFNSTPWSFERRRIDRKLELPRRTRALFSWPARDIRRGMAPMPFPFLPIDHVYAGKDWRMVSVRRGPLLGSDHYPVVITLEPVFRGPPPPGR